jgi:hypothetical protein
VSRWSAARFKLTVNAKEHGVDGFGLNGDVDFKVWVPIRLVWTGGSDNFNSRLEGEAPATDLRGPEIFAVTSSTSKKRGTKTRESPVSERSWGVAHQRERRGETFVLQTMKAGVHPRMFSYDWDGKGSDANITANDSTKLVLEHTAQ